MNLDNAQRQRLFALHPDFRDRIERYMVYHPSFDPESEITYSEKALELFRELKGEGPIYFWTTANRENRLGAEIGLERFNDDELDHIGRLTLQYVRNPLSVKDVTIYVEDNPPVQADEGDETHVDCDICGLSVPMSSTIEQGEILLCKKHLARKASKFA